MTAGHYDCTTVQNGSLKGVIGPEHSVIQIEGARLRIHYITQIG